MTANSRFISFLANRSGTSAIEFALVIPFLAAMVLAIAECGYYFMKTQEVQRTVRNVADIIQADPADLELQTDALYSNLKTVNFNADGNYFCAQSYHDLTTAKDGLETCNNRAIVTTAPSGYPAGTPYYIAVAAHITQVPLSSLTDFFPNIKAKTIVKIGGTNSMTTVQAYVRGAIVGGTPNLNPSDPAHPRFDGGTVVLEEPFVVVTGSSSDFELLKNVPSAPNTFPIQGYGLRCRTGVMTGCWLTSNSYSSSVGTPISAFHYYTYTIRRVAAADPRYTNIPPGTAPTSDPTNPYPSFENIDTNHPYSNGCISDKFEMVQSPKRVELSITCVK